MIGEHEVQALADLSRVAITDEEKSKLQHDLEAILSYVSELPSGTSVVGAVESERPNMDLVTNIMRVDSNPNERGSCTEVILNEAPRVKEGFLEVKKILETNN